MAESLIKKSKSYTMNEIEFVIKQEYKGVQILVDGKDLLALLGANKFFTYLHQDTFYGSVTKSKDFLASSYSNLLDEEYDDDTIIFKCNCHIIECDCIFIEVEKTKDEIIWKNFKTNSGVDYHLMESLKFNRETFEKKIEALKPIL